MGFSDTRLGKLTGNSAEAVMEKRRALGVRPVFKRIDTCAAEFASPTAYMYSTYETPFAGQVADEARPSDKKKIIILGGGPNRIGQGIEFDYCCCHAAFALKEAGYETIMINCNPETVSTDYDTSDRLYFEPLTPEDVLEIIDTERGNGTLHGVIVQFGGQTPLKLAEHLEKAKVPILGTSPDMIDLAEDRDRFKTLLDKLKVRQPQNGIATSPGAARAIADEIGYPVVIRPSYVLGGRAMEIVRDAAQLDRYVARLAATLDKPSELVVSKKSPLLIDRYLSDATEVDVDCLCDGKDTFIAGIMEHIEEAGIHSGDSACALPPHSLDAKTIAELERQTRELALALNVGGLMNVQYAIKDGDIYVLEVNPRASRTVPFVAKVIGLPVAKIASRIMAGESLASFNLKPGTFKHRAVKEAVFPFARFPGVDTVLGPEMKSTGEVMGIDGSFEIAFAKSQIGGGTSLPRSGTVFVSVKDATSRASCRRSSCWPRSASRPSPPREPSAIWPNRGWRRPRSTRCWKAGPISSMPSKTARFSWFSTPPRGPPPWPTAARCATPPSCIKCRTTPLFRVPSPRRRASKPISGATSRCVRCRATSAAGLEGLSPRQSEPKARRRELGREFNGRGAGEAGRDQGFF